MTNNNFTESTIKVGTFFSGIGAPEKAFQRLKEEGIIKDYKLEFFSEIDKNAIKSFCVIHNVSETLNLFKQDLIDLGYSLYDKVLNAVYYGVPQTRKRYFLVAILDNDKTFKFIDGKGCNKTLLDYLEKDVNEKYYLTDSNY